MSPKKILSLRHAHGSAMVGQRRSTVQNDSGNLQLRSSHYEVAAP